MIFDFGQVLCFEFASFDVLNKRAGGKVPGNSRNNKLTAWEWLVARAKLPPIAHGIYVLE